MENESSAMAEVARDITRKYCFNGVCRPVAYEPCYIYEPINWLYVKKGEGQNWREETWAFELFFQGPDGERGGALFAAVKDDPVASLTLDKIALLSLRESLLTKLLEKYWNLTFSINVSTATLADEHWFRNYVDEFTRSLQEKDAIHRVILEIQKHEQKESDQSVQEGSENDQRFAFLRFSDMHFALDEVYEPDQVFTITEDNQDGKIAWQKMDWKYFQEKVLKKDKSLKSTLEEGLKNQNIRLVVEGVELDLHKNFLCTEVLTGEDGEYVRISIQSPNNKYIEPE
jgi:hypothetical protein